MSRVRIAVVLCIAIVAVAFAAAGSSAADTKLYAFMDGKSETPKKGDADGHARIALTFKRASGQVCYDIRKTGLETAQAAHIHRGAKGKAGPIVIPLFGTTKGAGKGKITGCAKATRLKMDQVVANPSGFYANIHTLKFGDGAVRGQLSTKKP
jgi:hypothetical protein